MRFSGLDQSSVGTVYAPLWQSLGWIIQSNATIHFTLRTESDPSSLVPWIRQILRELDPTLALTNVATADELVRQALDTPRSLAVLVAAFASVALMLSLVGVRGAMSCTRSSRGTSRS